MALERVAGGNGGGGRRLGPGRGRETHSDSGARPGIGRRG